MSLERILDDLKDTLSSEQRAAVKAAVEASALDPYGDGDQSPIPDPDDPEVWALQDDIIAMGQKRMSKILPLRSARMTGLDFISILGERTSKSADILDFHVACFMGYASQVRISINLARRRERAGHKTAMTRLLESRLSLLRGTPLHYACFGAYTVTKNTFLSGGKGWVPEVDLIAKHDVVIQELLRAGARVDSKDICGHTPLAYAAGMEANENSIKLIPLLVGNGADLNARNRFDEVVITDSIMGENSTAFQALLDAGADLDAKDGNGISVLSKATFAPNLGQAWINERRKRVLSAEACDSCGKKGASKFCGKCRKIYYCSRACQVAGWKSGHKAVCGKEDPGSEYVEIDLNTMVLSHVNEATGEPIELCSVTGSRTGKKMEPKNIGEPFSLGVFLMMEPDRDESLVVVFRRNEGFLRLKNKEEGYEMFKKLEEKINKHGENTRCIYVLGKWLEAESSSGSGSEGSQSHILRLDLSKFLPPPKELW